MKVCLVGHFDDNIDEGVRNITKNIFNNLKNTDISIEIVEISSIKNLKRIKNFNADIIHFILTPTVSGIIISKLISILNLNSKVIISAIHPSIPKNKLLRIFKVDKVLVQSLESNRLFSYLGFPTEYLYNGVNVTKFCPNDEKIELREKYGISTDQFIVLHLASLKRERNLDIFKEIQKKNNIQVLLIGRENEDFDKELVDELRKAECLVCIKHFKNIEDIYNLSDCYIFPTINKKACIETPLSVLEAMACNLPVISTKFGALPDLYSNNNDNGLFFVNNDEDILEIIDILQNKNVEIRTRNDILQYSWEKIIERLGMIYETMLQ